MTNGPHVSDRADPWYRDTGQLLDEVRLSERREEAGRPEIDGYADLREIGRGGQGAVYEAVQVSTRRRVAIKVLLERRPSGGRGDRRRFEREIDLVADLRHPGIVQVYDSGATGDGRLYFVMEYVEGRPLDEVVDLETPRDPRGADGRRGLELFAEIGEAVSHAHQRGVLHRDLKPGNILIDDQGRPRVVDFGLAKPLGGEGDDGAGPARGPTAVSLTGQFLGSLPWASPEQVEPARDGVDVRGDVYALGVILYQMFTGRFPYPVTGPLREVLDNIVRAAPAPPRSLERRVDDELETIILKCLAKEPARRYQSAAELVRDVRRYLAGELIEAKRDSTWYTLSKTLRRHKVAAAASVSGLVALTGFGIAMAVLWSRAVDAETLASRRLTDVEHERDKVAAVNEFLLGAFSPAAAGGSDEDVTVRELLDKASAQVEQSSWLADHPDVRAEVHNALSYWFGSFSRVDEAERHQLASMALRRELYGPADRRLLENYRNLRNLRGQAADPEAAMDWAVKESELCRALREPDVTGIAIGLSFAAHYALEAGRPELAEAHARALRELAEGEIDGNDAWRYAHAGSQLAAALTAQRRYDEAEPLALSAHARLLEMQGATGWGTQQAVKTLVALYEAWGRPEEARKWKGKAES